MRFAGLFVGVDRQEDPDLSALIYSGRDAESLWGAFQDANAKCQEAEPADAELLVGSAAARDATAAALDRLIIRTRQNDYGMVVVHFACHGTEGGHLLLADSRLDQITETGLPIRDIAAKLRQISGTTTVVVFDSCFSGSVLRPNLDADGGSGDWSELMRSFAEGNRAVVWASGPDERSWESPHRRHGVLTFGLLNGLYGTHLVENGQIQVARWLIDAVDVAQKEARAIGRVQTPGCVISLNSTPAPTLPQFHPGPLRRKQMEEEGTITIGDDPGELSMYGFSSELISAVRSRLAGNPLNGMQLRAIAPGGVLAGGNVLVAAPTSSGKTLIGELAALRAWKRRLKTVVLLPMRALAAEKFQEFDDAFGNLGVRAIRSFGGMSDDDHRLIHNHFDVAFLTYEKFALLSFAQPRLMDALGLVVLDEVHLLGEKSRGRVVELILTVLRDRQRSGSQVQIVALSAALGELRGLPEWLDAELVTEDKRPVPLVEGVVTPDGIYRYLDEDRQERRERVLSSPIRLDDLEAFRFGDMARARVARALSARLAEDGERVLVFSASRPGARTLARELARDLNLRGCDDTLAQIAPDNIPADHSRASRELHNCLKRGTAFHVSDLERAEREAIELAFRSGEITVLCATSGLAMGINTPASAIVLVDNEFFDGQAVPYRVSEYRNMAGRAGRWIPGVERGTSYLVAESVERGEELWERYINGQPEPLESQLGSLAQEDLALMLLALSGRTNERSLVLTAASTFNGHQHREDNVWRAQLSGDLRDVLRKLEKEDFVERFDDGTLDATERGRICAREGLSYASADRVLRAAQEITGTGGAIDEITLIGLAQVTEELDALYTPFGKGDLEPWPGHVRTLFASKPALLRVLENTADSTRTYIKRLKRLLALSMWVRGKPMEEIERVFTRYHQPEAPAAGDIRRAADRTADVLRPVARLLAIQFPADRDKLKEQTLALRPRLELGITLKATRLIALRLGITRAQAHQLIAAGIDSADALRHAAEETPDVLYPIFGSQSTFELTARLRRRTTGREAAPRPEVELERQREIFDAIGDPTDI